MCCADYTVQSGVKKLTQLAKIFHASKLDMLINYNYCKICKVVIFPTKI